MTTIQIAEYLIEDFKTSLQQDFIFLGVTANKKMVFESDSEKLTVDQYGEIERIKN